ncbi:MAG TPA: hypothetical protein VKD72_04110, partial [Gemmataceae bacterium]|nr:hypothetical protein [Gemmataceae bacterium]
MVSLRHARRVCDPRRGEFLHGFLGKKRPSFRVGYIVPHAEMQAAPKGEMGAGMPPPDPRYAREKGGRMAALPPPRPAHGPFPGPGTLRDAPGFPGTA